RARVPDGPDASCPPWDPPGEAPSPPGSLPCRPPFGPASRARRRERNRPSAGAALLSDDLALALELADKADEISQRHFRAADLVVETKPDLTPVTIADRAVEDALRGMVPSTDAVVGEESGASGPDDSSRRWIIDPIDGTKNFVRNIPVWATLIALEVDGEITVGVASAPALGRRWWAARGLGAFADGQPIHVSAVAALGNAQLSYSSLSGWADIGT